MERPLPTHFFPPMVIHDGLAPFCHEIQHYYDNAETSENRPPRLEEFDRAVLGKSYIIPDLTSKEEEAVPKAKKRKSPQKTREELLQLVKNCTEQIENIELEAEESELNDDYRFEQFEEKQDYREDSCWLGLHKNLRRIRSKLMKMRSGPKCLGETDDCVICLRKRSKNPVMCLQCNKIIGCKRCVKTWKASIKKSVFKCLRCQRKSPTKDALFICWSNTQ